MKQYLILIFTIALISPCFAQPTPTATPTPENKEIPVVQFPSEFYQRRLNKKFSVTAGAGRESVTTAVHVAGAIFLNPNNILELRIADGESSNDEITMVTLGLKSFLLSGTFYVKPSFGFVEKTHVRDALFYFNNDGPQEKVRGEMVSLNIGNQWQFKNFTIGCEWFGYGRVFHSQDTKNDPNRDLITLLAWYVGWSF